MDNEKVFPFQTNSKKFNGETTFKHLVKDLKDEIFIGFTHGTKKTSKFIRSDVSFYLNFFRVERKC